jgi:hypothetical protein
VEISCGDFYSNDGGPTGDFAPDWHDADCFFDWAATMRGRLRP